MRAVLLPSPHGDAERMALTPGETVLTRQLRLLPAVGVRRIAVVATRDAIDPDLLGATRAEVVVIDPADLTGLDRWGSDESGDMLVLDGDAVFDLALLQQLASSVEGDVAVDAGTDAARMPVLAKLTPERLVGWRTAIDSGSDPRSALRAVVSGDDVVRLSLEEHFAVTVRPDDDPAMIASQLRPHDIMQQPAVVEGSQGAAQLVSALGDLNVERPLVVCNHDFEPLEVMLRLSAPDIHLARIDAAAGPATPTAIADAVQLFRAQGCDAILAIGDDSAIDLAKCVRVHLAREPQTEHGGNDRRPATTPFVIVPIAAARGSQAIPSARLLDGMGIGELSDDRMLADLVVLSPLASATLGADDRAVFALDVLAGAVDALLTMDATPLSTATARQAIEIVSRSIFQFAATDSATAHLNMATAADLVGKATALSSHGTIRLVASALEEHGGVGLETALAMSLTPVLRAAAAFAEHSETRAEAVASALETVREALDVRSTDAVLETIARVTVRFGLEAAVDADGVIPLPASGLDRSLLPLDTERFASIIADVRASAAHREADGALDLSLLVALAEFCDRHDVTYYLFGEALRDAVVHRRVTPWNSELSVAMPRADYAKLHRLRGRLPSGLRLAEFRSPKSAAPRPHIVRSDRTVPGTGVSIHVLDGQSANAVLRAGQAFGQRLVREALRGAHHAPSQSRNPLRRGLRFAARSLNAHTLDVIAAAISNTARRPETYLDLLSARAFGRVHYPATWFGAGRDGVLNGYPFRLPARATTLLVREYGRTYRHPGRIPSSAELRPTPPMRDDVRLPKTPRPVRDDPFISIVVPVYNVEKYLPACLDSVCGQEYERFEVIAVDDGSPDGSRAVMDEYAARHPDRLRVLDKPNGGLADARNFGLEHAGGEYVLFVDSDDVISRRTLRLLADRIRATDADTVAFGMYDYWAETGLLTKRELRLKEHYGESVAERPELLVAATPYAVNKIYRRALFMDHDIRYPKGQAFEDSATTFNLLLEANRIEFLDESLYFYRRDNPGSITNQVDDRFYDILKSFDSIRGYFQKRGAYSRLRPELQEIMRQVTSARITYLEGSSNYELVEPFLDAAYDYLDKREPGWATNKYFREVLDAAAETGNERMLALPHRDRMKAFLTERAQANAEAAASGGFSTAELGRMLQQESLRLLLRVDAFCRTHEVTYYLAEGTLLGAIRHHGFVPWDDDVDICMPRADYERFIELLQSPAADGLVLFNERTYPAYHLTFTKVLASEPSDFRTMEVDVPERFMGPAIDIFPLDAGQRARDVRRERRVRWLRDVMLFKVGYLNARNRPRQRSARYASRVLGFRLLQRAVQRHYRAYETGSDTGYLVNFASSYQVPKEKFSSAWLGVPQRVQFEGHLLPVPSDPDAVLRTTYGDYMRLPPVGKRVFRHRPLWRGQSMKS